MNERNTKNQIKPPVKIDGVKHIIAISSGKGGVGKSTVTVNLAIALSKLGAKVGIVDGDITNPNIPLMLGITEPPEVVDSKIKPILAHGIYSVSMGMLANNTTPIVWRGPLVGRAIGQLFHNVAWQDIDYLLIDLPPGTSDAQIAICHTVPLAGAIIVSTPQKISVIDSMKGLTMFENMGIPVLGVVENMSYFIAPDTNKRYDIFGESGLLLKEVDVELLGQIPLEIPIREAGDTGIPISISQPTGFAARAFADIANKIKI